ncbi:MAG: helix-turn-helix transcriptional regulator [Planctomycetota bacterium]|jgi:AraC-like DNA-binding protein
MLRKPRVQWQDKKRLLDAQPDQRVLPHNRALAQLAENHVPVALEGLVVKVEMAHILTFPPGYRAGEHVHPHFELMLLERGRMYYQVGEERFVVRPGEMFFMPPGGLAQWRSRKYRVHLRGLMCDFTPTLSVPAALGHRFNEAWLALGGRLVPPPELVVAWDALKREVVERRSDYMKAAASYLDVTLTLAFRAIRERLPVRPSHGVASGTTSADRAVLAAKAFARANLLKGVGPREMAEYVGYSLRHLNRLFHKSEGCSVGNHLAGLKIDRARKLLREERFPVKAVARMCGFRDPRYFARVFRRLTGSSPRQFSRA